MRRTALLLLAALLAACGGDDGPSAADDEKAANRAIAAFEEVARGEGFTVEPDDDDDEDVDLEFRSAECKDLERALDDDDVEGETADEDSEDFERSVGEAEETMSASVVFADADALAAELEAMDDERTAPCIEEALEVMFGELAADTQGLTVEARDVEVTLDRPALGDGAVLIEARGAIGIDVLELPFAMQVLAVQEGRQGVTLTYTAFGTEPAVELADLVDVLFDRAGAA